MVYNIFVYVNIMKLLVQMYVLFNSFMVNYVYVDVLKFLKFKVMYMYIGKYINRKIWEKILRID